MGMLRLWLATLILLNPDHIGGGAFVSVLFSPPAVEGFFIMSGFYLQQIIHSIPKHSPWMARFYLSRALRIYPTYWLVLALTFAVTYFAPQFYGIRDATMAQQVFTDPAVSHATRAAYVLGNISLMEMPALRASHSYYLLVPQAWTLVVEMLFYLCVPLLCTVSWRRLVGLFLLFAFLRYEVTRYIWVAGTKPPQARDFILYLPHFLAGALAFRFYTAQAARRLPLWFKHLMTVGTAAAILTLSVLDTAVLSVLSKQAACTLFVLLVLLASPFLAERFHHSRLDRYVGWLSYPFYLVHLLVGCALSLHFPNGSWQLGAAAWLGSLLAAVVIVHLVDIPITRYRHRIIDTSGKA